MILKARAGGPCHRRSAIIALLLATSATLARGADDPAQVVVGAARFTVVTPNLVRIEYAKDGTFVDDKSMFAVNRDARAKDVQVKRDGDVTLIVTPALTLRYAPDGKPLSKDNLTATIALPDGKTTTWTPGAPNPGNLGGTVRTLDGWDGPGDLGQGVISRDGWAVIDDSRSPLFTADWVRERPAAAGTDWYLFAYGDDYRAAMKSLTTIGGRAPLPRKYTLGAWYSRYWPYTSDEFRAIVKEYEQHDFPLDVMVLDMDWHKDGWTGYSWNRKLLPDAEGLLKDLHAQGLHVTLNDHPADGVGPHEDRYDAFMKAIGEDPSTRYTVPYDAGSQKYLSAHYDQVMRPLAKDGVDFWWLDWQQYPHTRSLAGLTNLFWLNHFYYGKTAEDGKRGQIFSRWGGPGSHRYPIQFSGDASTTFRMLAFEVPFTATAGNVGAFFWSHDIGGHVGGRNEESYARWSQFGATTAALRSHSTRSADLDRRPWTYSKWVEDSIRKSYHLRSTLMPYLYTSAHQTSSESVPLNRPMYFDYPKEERAYHSPQQYLLGDHVLVAPITMEGKGPRRVGWTPVWFPPGDAWFNLITGEKYEGGTEPIVAADIDEFPIFVRAGVPLSMRPYTPRMGTAPLDTLVLRCYPGEEGKTGTVTLYEDDGVTTGYERGESATTEVSYTYNDGKATIHVKPTVGKYEGQMEQRAITIELPGTEDAEVLSVTETIKQGGSGNHGLNNAKTYDARTQTNTFTLPARSIRNGCVIQVTAALAKPDAIAESARARRAGDASVDLKADGQSPSMQQRLAAALASAKPDADVAPLLAAFGIATFEKNETPYRFPEKGTFGLYAPPGLIDGDKVVYRSEEGSDKTVPIALRRDPALGGLAPLTFAAAAQLAPLRGYRTRVDFTIGGRVVSLPGETITNDFKAFDENVAPKAKATASSGTRESPAAGVIEGHVGGYPRVRRHEWSSEHEKAGAALTLTWEQPQTVDRVWLFDRPNPNDQVTAGELIFDDGTTVPFGELPNDAESAAEVKFNVKTTRSITVKVKSVKASTENVGLSEVVVLKAK